MKAFGAKPDPITVTDWPSRSPVWGRAVNVGVQGGEALATGGADPAITGGEQEATGVRLRVKEDAVPPAFRTTGSAAPATMAATTPMVPSSCDLLRSSPISPPPPHGRLPG